jgi:predicted polyphosphate/ATP-dependent NAD kinase
VGKKIPILGIPSGVKMHSGVFGVNTESVSDILVAFIEGRLDISDVEILDLDEDRYREGMWSIRLFGSAKTPFEPNFTQGGKAIIEGEDEEEIKEDIASFVVEKMEEEGDTLYVLGPGSTTEFVSDALEVDGSLLGIDAVKNKELVAKDVNEKKLLELLSLNSKAKLVVSPIGAQGFILGRGNLQLSPEVLRIIGIDNILVLSTPAKLARTPTLRVDTGDSDLNHEFARKQIIVIIGYHAMRLMPISV